MLNNVSIMGRFTKDPELKTTPNGISVTSFAIGCDRNFKEKGSSDYTTDFFEITAWRKTAEFICSYFRKGDLAAFDGTLQTRTYVDKNNVTHKVVEIIASSAYFCEKKKDGAQQGDAYGQPPYAQHPASYDQQSEGYAAPNVGYIPPANGYVPQDNEFNNIPDDFYPGFND